MRNQSKAWSSTPRKRESQSSQLSRIHGNNSEWSLSVAAGTDADELWALSNFGKSTVHIAAPGLEVPTATRRMNPYTISFNGTSAAVPHVAGAIALLAAISPTASPAEIKAALLGSADGAPGFAGRVLCNGRLNVGRALAQLSRLGSPPIVISVKPAGAVPRERLVDGKTTSRISSLR
jgi:subtilisin family serine protease